MSAAALHKTVDTNPVFRQVGDITLRLAGPDDAERILQLLLVMGKENALFEPDLNDVRETIRGILINGTCLLAEKGEHLIGAAALYVTNWWYNRKRKYVSDYFFFIHPKHRNFPLAKALVDECKRCAKYLGMPLVLGVMVKKDPVRKLRFFQRQMTPLGGFFISGL